MSDLDGGACPDGSPQPASELVGEQGKLEDLILELLGARRRGGEPWWPLDARHRSTVDDLVRQGLVEHIGDEPDGSLRVQLTEAGEAKVLFAGWTDPVQRRLESLTEDLTDAAGISWWHAQARRIGVDPMVLFTVAEAMQESLRAYGRLYLGPDPRS